MPDQYPSVSYPHLTISALVLVIHLSIHRIHSYPQSDNM